MTRRLRQASRPEYFGSAVRSSSRSRSSSGASAEAVAQAGNTRTLPTPGLSACSLSRRAHRLVHASGRSCSTATARCFASSPPTSGRSCEIVIWRWLACATALARHSSRSGGASRRSRQGRARSGDSRQSESGVPQSSSAEAASRTTNTCGPLLDLARSGLLSNELIGSLQQRAQVVLADEGPCFGE